MGGIDTETGSQDSDLYARLDELERMVRRLMGEVSIPSAVGTSLQPLAADYHHGGHAHREPATRPSFGSLARAPLDGRHGDAGPRGFDSGRAKLVRRLIRKRRQRDQHFPSDLFADPERFRRARSLLDTVMPYLAMSLRSTARGSLPRGTVPAT